MRFDAQTPSVQQRFGVAAGLGLALEHQVACRLVGLGGVKVAGHGLVQRIAGVLLIDHRGHALKGGTHLGFADHPVVHPIGNVLARNTQCGTVLHQAHVVNVGHFGATHALIDPAHHITQNALHVVVQLLLLF